MWEHNISVSGGNEKLNYYLSGNTVDQTGIFRQNPDKYKVYNFRSKISAKITPRLTISTIIIVTLIRDYRVLITTSILR